MRTINWETASRISLRNPSKELGEGQYIYDLVKEECMQLSTYFFAEGYC